MDLLPDDAQQEIVDSTATFLADAMPIERLRAHGVSRARPDPALLARMAELGWFGLGLSATQGGIGFSLVEETLLFREFGRSLGSVGVLATAIAVHVAAASGDAQRLEQLLAGRLRVGWAEPFADIDLTGALSAGFQVFDGEEADLWLAANASGAVLLDPRSASRRVVKPCLDEFSALLHAEFAAARPLAVATREERVFERASVLVSAMLMGIAELARDRASSYAQERFQFGKPIGVFQAIKHRCADMAVRCEAGWSQTCYAALALRDGHDDGPFQVSVAKSLAGEAASANAAANLQVHGGYGFTTEYDAHLLVKRAHVLNAMAGTLRRHLQRILDAPSLT